MGAPDLGAQRSGLVAENDRLRRELGEARRQVGLLEESLERLSNAADRHSEINELVETREALTSVNAELEARVLTRTRELVREQETLEAVIGWMGVAVAVVDADGSFVRWNAAATAVTGVSQQALDLAERPEGFEAFEMDGTTVVPSSDAPLVRALAGERVEHRELMIDNPKIGETRCWSVSARPLGGTHGGAVLVAHDITREVAERQRLERSNAALQQFAYIASHDLQEPLRKVSSFVGVLREEYGDAVDEGGRAYMDFAVDGAQRMQVLVQDLLSYARVQSAGGPMKVVDCNAVFADVLDDLALQITESGASITSSALPRLRGDTGQLRQLFQNLLSNALKYRSGASPQIRVSAELDRHRWRISVEDNGIGIEPRFRERVFQIFQRLHSRSEYPGTGIGLALCRQIVERHAGKLWVEDTQLGGVALVFTLPSSQVGVAHAPAATSPTA